MYVFLSNLFRVKLTFVYLFMNIYVRVAYYISMRYINFFQKYLHPFLRKIRHFVSRLNISNIYFLFSQKFDFLSLKEKSLIVAQRIWIFIKYKNLNDKKL